MASVSISKFNNAMESEIQSHGSCRCEAFAGGAVAPSSNLLHATRVAAYMPSMAFYLMIFSISGLILLVPGFVGSEGLAVIRNWEVVS
jgi:hypothetical protein